jgi:phage terminase Nu1 subunit (DNA packaging protein)
MKIPETKEKRTPERIAYNYEQLAKALGITRRTIQNYRTQFSDCPMPNAAGYHDVTAWERWLEVNDKGDHALDKSLKDHLLGEQIRKLKLANDAMEQKFVALNEVIAAMRPTVLAIRSAMDSMPSRAARKFQGDFHDNLAILEHEKNLILRSLEGAAWFDERVEVDVSPVAIDVSDIPSGEGVIKPPQKRGRKPKAKG